jgi:hypothetical protein
LHCLGEIRSKLKLIVSPREKLITTAPKSNRTMINITNILKEIHRKISKEETMQEIFNIVMEKLQ